ncbi:hypothetical protein RX828_28135, partial [Pseudomonas syringae pv. actinidiae]|nr:hypothetical protein [Pseudomonas syringae pv. actinidiae]
MTGISGIPAYNPDLYQYLSPLGQRYSPISNTCAQPTGKDMRQELGRHIKLFISLLWGSNH